MPSGLSQLVLFQYRQAWKICTWNTEYITPLLSCNFYTGYSLLLCWFTALVYWAVVVLDYIWNKMCCTNCCYYTKLLAIEKKMCFPLHWSDFFQSAQCKMDGNLISEVTVVDHLLLNDHKVSILQIMPLEQLHWSLSAVSLKVHLLRFIEFNLYFDLFSSFYTPVLTLKNKIPWLKAATRAKHNIWSIPLCWDTAGSTNLCTSACEHKYVKAGTASCSCTLLLQNVLFPG